MELKEFIKETLIDIAKAVEETNKELTNINGFIATDNIRRYGDETIKTTYDSLGREHMVSDIKFDVAVSVSETNSKQGGGKIAVLSAFNAKGEKQKENSVNSTSRLNFTLPLALPFGQEKNNK